MVVLHHTAMASCEAALSRLCDPITEVSAHYLISETGVIFHLVHEEMRAWHAGTGCWGEMQDVNSHSVGIELANGGPQTGFSPFPEPQMAALEHLLTAILARWTIPRERVIAHSDMAPLRKFDPGAKFDWRRLARQNLSVWPKVDEGQEPNFGAFRADCTAFGYPCDVGDAQLLAAFRLRFRANVKGLLDQTDMAMAHDLGRRFPVDALILTT
ncbi:MAG: N-acetylmuramoyl-L-alanine amidase [Alphaproteobacteria bacterium]|nr:N-acetylmuramoyl-L-alanine amidase [Alphaproteobacteria bacterium]